MVKPLVVILLLTPLSLLCQTGAIRGQVTDAHTGQALVGANVVVVGSRPGHGAATDLNGMFLMTKIQPGEYVLQASYIEYQTATQRNVKVTAGQTTEADFVMTAESDSDQAPIKSGVEAIVVGDTTSHLTETAEESVSPKESLQEQTQ